MDLRAIAEEIRRAQDECRPVQPIARRTKGFDDAAAYEVARLVHEARIREGWSPVGRKIGFTNRNIWPIYGVYQPIWSYIYDTTVAHLPASSGACTLRGLADPRLEPEVALH